MVYWMHHKCFYSKILSYVYFNFEKGKEIESLPRQAIYLFKTILMIPIFARIINKIRPQNKENKIKDKGKGFIYLSNFDKTLDLATAYWNKITNLPSDFFHKMYCPKCHKTCKHNKHSYYERHYYNPLNNYSLDKILILVIKCKRCKGYNAVLPIDIVPYQWMLQSDQMDAIIAVAHKDDETINQMSDDFCFDKDYLYRIHRKYLKQWSHVVSLNKLESFQAADNSLILKKYRKVFLQSNTVYENSIKAYPIN